MPTLLPAGIGRPPHTPFGPFLLILGAVATVGILVVGGIYLRLAGHLPGGTMDAVRTILLSVLTLLMLLGGVLGWVVALAHRSRLVAMTEAQHHVAKLEEEVRAHAATARELHKAKEAAEAANAAKSRYLVSVSHEIRSPLNSIYGYAQLMERGHDIAPTEAAKIIRRSAEHLTNLVEGLLDISHVESGVLRISNDTVRFAPFLDQIADMFRPQALAKGIDFIYDRPDGLPDFIRTDQKRLRQVLINLLSNAVKFTKAGSVTFRVSNRGHVFAFAVEDTGIGIAPEDLERIFAPFERGSNPDAQRERGLGLGLSITDALVRILGGEVVVTSQPGQGTTFTTRLMLGQVAPIIEEVKPTEPISGYEGPRRSILLIDDDPDQIALLGKLLGGLGFSVETALDGDAGLAAAARKLPDLVLLDITMPGKSGWETARLLREAHGGKIRIVMVSADAHEFRRGGDGRASHDMFLIKPVELNALLDLVSDQLGVRWTRPQIEQPAPAPVVGDDWRVPDEAWPYLTEVEHSLRIAHVRGIEEKLRALDAAVPDAAPLTARLFSYLDRFDLAGLAHAIKAAR